MGLFSFLLAACKPSSAPTEQTTPTPAATPESTPAATPLPLPTGTPLATPASQDPNQVTVHYYRPDGHYDGVELWTWDGYEKHSPAQNTLGPVSRDKEGLVFRFNRQDYGESDKIGLLPRIGHDWSHKDGGDRFWTPALGNEVWLVSGKNPVFAGRPDLSPHVEAAYLDGPKRIAARLSNPTPDTVQVTLLDQRNVAHAIASVAVSGEAGSPNSLTIIPKEPLEMDPTSYRVQVTGFGAPVALTPRGILTDPALFFDPTARLGAFYGPQATTFRLFAPTASAVSVVLYAAPTGGAGRTTQSLRPTGKGLWEATINGDLRGRFYVYQLTGPGLDPQREVLDPYATNAVASSTRGLIASLPAPPRPGPVLASPTDLVIYEMHVRDFTSSPTSGVQNRGRYLGFTEGNTRLPGDPSIRTALDHLVELGVTHVELLPVQDFANDEAHPQFNWGYITSAFFSPEGMYATHPDDDSRTREFRALVDALHARGIGVIMDVVYNHTAQSAPFNSVVPGYYYRHLADGSPANGSGCGNEYRSDAPMARKLILDSLKFWTREYGVDGYRFDLMALLDQETMRQAEGELRAIKPGIVLYGEPWTGGDSPLQEKTNKSALLQVPVGAFNDDFRNALKGSPDGSDPGFIQNGSNRDALKAALTIDPWLATPGQSVNYLTCHDNLVLWDKLKHSMPGADDQTLVETMKLGYLALFTSQGVPFIQGGEEFGRTKDGNNNSYDSPDSVNQVDWSLKRKHLDLFTYTRDLIALRKAHPAFRLRTRQEVAKRLQFVDTPDDKVLMYTLDAAGVMGESWRKICVVLNSDGQAGAEIKLPDGRWSVALDEHGAATDRSVSGNVNVRQKSGLVLFQR